MLRLTLLILVLANAAYFAWAQRLLAPWGLAPAQQSEPHRLMQQIQPQAIKVLPGDEARRIEADGAPAECLQAGVFEEAQLAGLRQVLERWPSGSWRLDPAAEPARWIVYMGKYLTAENVARKKGELRQIGVSFETLANASLEPGLSLGGHATPAAAARQLEVLSERGVRTAKVVQEREEVRGQMLKLPAIDDSLRPRLDELKPALNGRNLRPCR
ncbi:MAG: SPOR domain-containing protein [Ramlibacter sp.]|nr:SPOR domain-containing protein [Ramlibacter sp.]